MSETLWFQTGEQFTSECRSRELRRRKDLIDEVRGEGLLKGRVEGFRLLPKPDWDCNLVLETIDLLEPPL